MKLPELQQQIIHKKLDHVYLFYGEEIAIMDTYLDKMYGVMDCDVIRTETVNQAYRKMTQKTLAGKPRCLVVRDDKEFLKQEKTWATIFQLADETDNYLILIYSAIDKRTKFFKQNKDRLTEFAYLDTDVLVRYIQNELNEFKYGKILAEICSNDYSRILLEVDKIKQYSNATGKSFNSSFSELKHQGVIHQDIGDITFQFTDAILTRNVKAIEILLDQARRKGEPEIMVLSILYNGFRQILMVQGLGSNQNDATKRTGLTPWQVKMAKDKQGHYSINELMDALEVVRFAEKGIKTGQLDVETSLEYVITNIV